MPSSQLFPMALLDTGKMQKRKEFAYQMEKSGSIDSQIKSATWTMVIWLLATQKVWKHP